MSDIDLSNNETIASYGIGLQMGQQLKEAFDGVSLEAALTGIEDAFNQREMRVPGTEINTAFEAIQAQLKQKEAEQAAELSAEGDAFLAENALRDEVVVTESGLQYEIIEAGNGAIPEAASAVRTHYRGTLINGTEFDSSYSRGEPAEFPVGGVISGWTEALQAMPVGSKWKLFIPHHLAYGPQGAGGAIGPYQALIFELELLDIVA